MQKIRTKRPIFAVLLNLKTIFLLINLASYYPFSYLILQKPAEIPNF